MSSQNQRQESQKPHQSTLALWSTQAMTTATTQRRWARLGGVAPQVNMYCFLVLRYLFLTIVFPISRATWSSATQPPP